MRIEVEQVGRFSERARDLGSDLLRPKKYIRYRS